MAATVTRQQFFSAVAQQGNMDTLYQSISMNTNDPAWISFWSAYTVTKGDTLATATQSVFGWTSAQMDALFDLAAGDIISPPAPIGGASTTRPASAAAFGAAPPTYSQQWQSALNAQLQRKISTLAGPYTIQPQLLLQSPGGTVWQVTVSDGGAITVSPAEHGSIKPPI